MRKVKIHTSTGKTLTVDLKTTWEDITLGEFISLQDAEELGKVSILTGLTIEQLEALDYTSSRYVEGLLETMPPLPEPVQGLNLLGETIGQLETAKQHIRKMSEVYPEGFEIRAAPLVYGLYKVKGFDGDKSQTLAKEALTLPVSEVWPFVQGCFMEMHSISERYAGLYENEDDEEEGENELAVFGFYGTLRALSGGDLLKHDAILQLPAIAVYTELVYRKKAADVEKRKQEQKKEKV